MTVPGGGSSFAGDDDKSSNWLWSPSDILPSLGLQHKSYPENQAEGAVWIKGWNKDAILRRPISKLIRSEMCIFNSQAYTHRNIDIDISDPDYWFRNSSHNLFKIRTSDGASCIGCKFGHQMVLVALPCTYTMCTQAFFAPFPLMVIPMRNFHHLHHLGEKTGEWMPCAPL